MLLGNDIVDLLDPIARMKHEDTRFLGRVCTLPERACVSAATQPNLALWMLWSAKESLFKALGKDAPALVFAPKKFTLPETTLREISRAAVIAGSLTAEIHAREAQFHVLWRWSCAYVHCIVSSMEARPEGKPSPCLSRVENWNSAQPQNPAEVLSAQETDSVYAAESRAARLLCKRLVREAYGFSDVEIIRARIGPRLLAPMIFSQGKALPIACSLSHDGNFAAAVIAEGN